MAHLKQIIFTIFFLVFSTVNCLAMNDKEVDDLSGHVIPLRTQTNDSLDVESDLNNLTPSLLETRALHLAPTIDNLNVWTRYTSRMALPSLGILKETLVFCAPYMLAKTVLGGNLLWNAYLYGQIDETAVASDGLIMTWQSLVTGTWLGGLQATSILVGQLHTDDESIAAARGNVGKVAFALSVGYSILSIPLLLEAGNISASLMSLFHLTRSPTVFERVQDYFNGFIWGVAPTLFLYNDEQFSLGIKDIKVPLIYDSIQTFVACTLAYPLALGKWGFPELGVRGIGYSMAAGAWVSWIALRMHYALDKKKYGQFKLYNFASIKVKAIKKYLEYAIPLGLANSVGLITNFTYSSFIVSFGESVASGYNACAAYFRGINITFSGYTSAITALVANKDIRVSNNLVTSLEQNDVLSIKKYYNASVITTTGLAILAAAPVVLWPDRFIGFFGNSLSENALRLAHAYIGFNITNSILTMHALAHESSLHGLKDVGVPLLINLSVNSCWLLFSGISIASSDNPTLVVAASVVGSGLSTVVYGIRWRQMFMKLSSQVNNVTGEENCFVRMWHKAKRTVETSFLGRAWQSVKGWFTTDKSTVKNAFKRNGSHKKS